MKHLLLMTIFAIATGKSYAQNHSLEFSINSVNSDKGKLYVQLFKGEDNFKKGAPHAAQIMPARKGNTLLVFSNLTPGEYAVRFFHDENNDGKMSTNLFGIPSEGYGFSNNAQPVMAPPSYQDSKFTITSDTKVTQNSSDVIY